LSQTPPELPVAFVDSPRGLSLALVDLMLKKIGCFEHRGRHNKTPRVGASKAITVRPAICSGAHLESPSSYSPPCSTGTMSITCISELQRQYWRPAQVRKYERLADAFARIIQAEIGL